MPALRLSMRKIREILRLRSLGLSRRAIARSLKIAPTSVGDYLLRAKAAGLCWPLPGDPDNAALERILFTKPEERPRKRPLPDWGQIHSELKRKHVTLALLWQEYKADHPDGYQYSQFCELYRRWEGKLGVWMRQPHRGGEKLFVDYSGDGIPWVDPTTGEVREAELFVAVLGASNYTFAMATKTQQLADWISCHVRAFEFLGGVPEIVVPDQTRTGTNRPCRYDPELNPTYQDLARHYGTCVIPARPRRPRDKAKVEVGVLLAQRWIIAALRHRVFQSVEEINQAIGELLEKINHRPMRKLKRSRRELFLEIDFPNLQPLAEKRFEFAEWKVNVRVNLDYHVAFEHNYYSVPYHYAHKTVDVRATSQTVEVFLGHKRIASHLRKHGKHRYSTTKEHMPRSHQEHLEWTPSRLVKWAETVGPRTAKLVEKIMQERPHPEQGYRACLGILRLGKRYSEKRLERACTRALACRCHSYRSVESILKNHLEDQPLPQASGEALPRHENLRGSGYYE